MEEIQRLMQKKIAVYNIQDRGGIVILSEIDFINRWRIYEIYIKLDSVLQPRSTSVYNIRRTKQKNYHVNERNI